MPIPLLQTKLHIPPLRADRVPRPQLVHKLAALQGRPAQVTLVVAPAGYGKTTALSAWHTANPEHPVAWLTLEEDDNDPYRFWRYASAAVERLAPIIPTGTLTQLPVEQMPEEAIVARFVNEVTAASRPFTLVLDDLHTITNEEILGWLGSVIDHQPPTLHLVLSTRTMPPLPWARPRAEGRLAEINTQDLRFTATETATFLRRTMGLGLDEGQVANLAERTEGWPAGLQLAGLSLQAVDDVAEALAQFSGSSRHLVDYFAEEVVRQQPEEVRSFLYETAFLDELNPSLCDTVTGRDDSGAILAYLERHNLFLMPQDDQHHWYAYHRLFAEHLRSRQDTVEHHSQLAARHRRVSAWCLEHNLIERAIQHAILAEDYNLALRLFNNHGFDLLVRGQAATVDYWIGRFPTAMRTTSPDLDLLAAWAKLSASRFAEAEIYIRRLERYLEAGWLADQPEARRDREGQVLALRATVKLNLNEMEMAVPLMQEALDNLHPGNTGIRSVVTLDLADVSLAADDVPEALRLYRSALEAAQPSGNIMISVNAMSKLARLQTIQGQLHAAAESYHASLETLRSQGADDVPVTGMLEEGITRLLYEWNDLDNARRHGDRALALLRRWGHAQHIASTMIALARIAHAAGLETRAQAVSGLDKAIAHCRQHNLRYPEQQAMETQARFALIEGDPDRARELYRRTAQRFPQAFAYDTGSQPSLHIVRPLLLEGRHTTADRILAAWQDYTETRGLVAQRIEVGVLQAVSAWRQDKRDTALQALTTALRLAETGGFIRTFLDEGPVVADLLQLALKRGTAPAYAAQLLEAATEAVTTLADPLSPRESEVLHLIAAQLSNQEIADKLTVSVNTVKTHIRRLYNKLGAGSRLEAVTLAQDLGLL